MIWEKQSGGLFRSNLIINLKRPIYKGLGSFAAPNGNVLATIKYSQKIKSYQTSSPIALFFFVSSAKSKSPVLPGEIERFSKNKFAELNARRECWRKNNLQV